MRSATPVSASQLRAGSTARPSVARSSRMSLTSAAGSASNALPWAESSSPSRRRSCDGEDARPIRRATSSARGGSWPCARPRSRAERLREWRRRRARTPVALPDARVSGARSGTSPLSARGAHPGRRRCHGDGARDLHARPPYRAAGLPALAERAAPGVRGRPSGRRAGHVGRVDPRRGQPRSDDARRPPRTQACARAIGHRRRAVPPPAPGRRARPTLALGRRRAPRVVLPGPRLGARRRMGHGSADPSPGRDVVHPDRRLRRARDRARWRHPPDDRHSGRARAVHRDRGARLRNRRREARHIHRHRPRTGARANHRCGRARRAGVRGRGRRPRPSALEALANLYGPYPWPSLHLAVGPGPRPHRHRVPHPDLPRRGRDRPGHDPRGGTSVVLLAGGERPGP